MKLWVPKFEYINIKEATGVRDIYLRNTANVRQQLYIRDIFALLIHARCTEVECTEHKCIDFLFRIYDLNLNRSEHKISQYKDCGQVNTRAVQENLREQCKKTPRALRKRFISTKYLAISKIKYIGIDKNWVRLTWSYSSSLIVFNFLGISNRNI